MRNGKNGWRTLYHRNFNEQHLDCYFTIFIRHDLLQQHLTCIQKTSHGLILIFFDKSSLISTGWFDGVLRTSMARLVSVVSLRGSAVQSSRSQSDPVCKTFSFPWDYHQRDSSFSARVSPCDFPQVNGVVACHYCFTWSLNLHPLTSCNTLEGFQGNRPTLQPPPIQQMHQRSIGTVQTTVKHSFFPFPSSPSLHCNLCCLQWKCRKNKRCCAGNGMRLYTIWCYIYNIAQKYCMLDDKKCTVPSLLIGSPELAFWVLLKEEGNSC